MLFLVVRSLDCHLVLEALYSVLARLESPIRLELPSAASEDRTAQFEKVDGGFLGVSIL